MKFKNIFAAAFAALLLLSGCGQDANSSSSAQPSPSPSSQEETLVTITLPASYFEGKTEKEVKAAAKKQGVDTVTQNEDGSYQYEMTATAHRRLVNEMRLSLVDSISSLPDGTNYPSVESASLSDDLSTLTLKVDSQAYQDSNDRTIARAVWPSLCVYYYFNNENPEKKSLTVDVRSAEDDSQVEQFVWPEEDENSSQSDASQESSAESSEDSSSSSETSSETNTEDSSSASSQDE